MISQIVTAQLVVNAVVLIALIHVILITVAMLGYVERKTAGYIQDRLGPNRVGFDFGLPALKFLKGMVGLGQPLADGLKLLLKEDYTPGRVVAVIPWGGVWICPDIPLPFTEAVIPGGAVHVTGAHVNVGIVYLVAVASLGVYGVTLGGWASNNKYSFLGALRATAQMISYEIPLGLSLLAVLLITGSILPEAIIRYQVDHGWLILSQPVAGALFFITALAEANRAPFDNAEAEQELVGGYHTEYSSMRFALFVMAEYAHLITSSAFFALLFLGGYHLPLVPGLDPQETALWACALKFVVYFGKVLMLVVLGMVIRWTVPRLRYDQVMVMAWQAVIPLALVVVVMTAVMVYKDLRGVVPMLAANAALVIVLLAILPRLPRVNQNRRLPLYGSRFSPMAGERVVTGPTNAAAIEDRPVEGTATAR